MSGLYFRINPPPQKKKKKKKNVIIGDTLGLKKKNDKMQEKWLKWL